MQRHNLTPRPNWQQTVEQQGLTFHTPEALAPGARPYWDESACYEFTSAEIDRSKPPATSCRPCASPPRSTSSTTSATPSSKSPPKPSR